MAKNQSEENLFWQGRQLEFASVEKKAVKLSLRSSVVFQWFILLIKLQ